MQKQITLFGVGLLLLIEACNKSKNRKEGNFTISDVVVDPLISSSAAVVNSKDTTRKFIRPADVKFKVKSVLNSTYDIENITHKQGGFVTYTNLTSNVNNVSIVAISLDSSLETTSYFVTNTISLRVPNTKLDTVLKEISRNIDYLDFRIIKADDVALQILSNNLSQKRSSKNEGRLKIAIYNRGKKLNEPTVAEELLSNKQEQADNANISNLSLKDQINFSTLTLCIYQRQSIKREVLSKDKNVSAYEAGFGSKFLESLNIGWEVLENLIIFLAKFWGLFLVGLIAYYLFRKHGNILKKSGVKN